ncbi:MAG: aryl-sulfate sulfotransferase [Planctomycetes bacterium]|nr:aryl-sulfate sulfotransferase [Planctomycetota bacterium]
MDIPTCTRVIMCLMAALLLGQSRSLATQDKPTGMPARDRQSRPGSQEAEKRQTEQGLLRHEPDAAPGYTLIAPMRSGTTYLVDMQGNAVHTWTSDAPPGQAVYLLENGNLLRCERHRDSQSFHGGGLGGRVRELAWDGTIVWEFVYSDDQHCQHHDIERLPNGNVLLIAWERKNEAEVLAAGRNPALGTEELWPDHIVEVAPEYPRGGRIVWEWHVWDHLIQDHDPARANFGVVGEPPELIDVNYDGSSARLAPAERRRLEALGYVAPPTRPQRRDGHADWNHTNAIDYNADLDQIVLSVLSFNEIWVIDHSTTTEEAAGHTGGRCGQGGDLLYRWGNPQTYAAGTSADQQLFAQHDVQWIERHRPGAGHLLVFNNGRGRTDGNYSTVDEIAAPVDRRGDYRRATGAAFGPEKPAWVYAAADKESFFAGHISGAQRLQNGNTLVCSGESGRLFEVTPAGRVVWEYISPFEGNLGGPGGPGGPRGRRPFPPLGFGAGEQPPERSGRPESGRRRGPPGAWGATPGDGPHGPPGQHDSPNALFRALRLPLDYPGLAGKDLTPKPPAETPPERSQRWRRSKP